VDRCSLLCGWTLMFGHKVVHVKKAGDEGYVALLERYSVHKDPAGVPPGLDNFGQVTVPQGEYCVMGDNRDNSLDSREWGFVPRPDIIGRGLLVYWSFRGDAEEGARAASRAGASGGDRLV